MAMINRDPFARESTHRERVYGKTGCTECGCTKRTPRGRAYLFRYFVERDGILSRKNYINGYFCSIDCMRAYNGN